MRTGKCTWKAENGVPCVVFSSSARPRRLDSGLPAFADFLRCARSCMFNQ